MEKMAWDGPKWGQDDVFPTNPDLANILGRADLNFEHFRFFDVLEPKFLDFQVPRSPKFQVHRSPNSQISKFPDFQVPRFPDAGTDAVGRTLRSQPDPSLNAPKDHMLREDPGALAAI